MHAVVKKGSGQFGRELKECRVLRVMEEVVDVHQI
jgi:hypothetical protein